MEQTSCSWWTVGASAAAAILDDADDRDLAERARTAVEAVRGLAGRCAGADLSLPGARAVGRSSDGDSGLGHRPRYRTDWP